MKKTKLTAVTAVFLTLLTLFLSVNVSAAGEIGGATVKIIAERTEIPIGDFQQLKAEITVPEGSDIDPDRLVTEWSCESYRCNVDETGLYYAVAPGNVEVKATVTDPESGEKITASVKIRNTTILDDTNDYLVDHTVMGYRYNKENGYYYYDQDNTWQKKMGFMNAFDDISTYLTLVYDYVRVNYNYGGKARMLQFWKGQYGVVFYGSEIGYYYRDEEMGEDEKIDSYTHFECASEDKLGMQTSLYWDKNNDGKYKLQFTVPYDQYWWCTGFKAGHLWNTDPCDELRLEGFIDLHDEEEAAAVAQGLVDCGFTQAAANSKLEPDSFFLEGNRITFSWRDISEAQNTEVQKSTVNALILSGGFALLFMPVAFFIMTFMFFVVMFFINIIN